MPTQLSLDTISKLISFDTTSRNSNLPLIDFVEDTLNGHGIPSKRLPDETGTKANLIATIGPADVPGYVLSGHTDTVPVDGQEWSSDPFEAEERDGRIFGRGTADMKSFVAIVLAKVRDMTAAPLTRPLHLAFSYDEEVGCLGARDIVADMAGWAVRPAACFVGEPTDMHVVIGHKGKRATRVEVTGRSAHSSLAPLAVNAVEYAGRLLAKIHEIGTRLRNDDAQDPLYDVPFTTAHVGPIQGGTALNIVPDHCVFEYEFRTIAQHDVDALYEEVRTFAEDVLVPEMQARAGEAQIAFSPKSQTPGLDTDAEAPVTTLAKALSGTNSHAKVAYGSEGGLFSQTAGIPTVLCGPGSITQAHKADEYIDLAQIDKCEAFLDKLIAQACRPVDG